MENRDPGRVSREDLVILAVQLREALVRHQAEFGTFNEFAKTRAIVNDLIAAITITDPGSSRKAVGRWISVLVGKPCIPRSLH